MVVDNSNNKSINEIEDNFLKLLDSSSYIDPNLYTKYNIKRGLRNSNGTGVLVGITGIANVVGYEVKDDKKVPIDGRLLYRGIPLTDLVDGFQKDDRFGFEETAFLLLLGKLPSEAALSEFYRVMEYNREFPKFFNEDNILKFPSNNMMNMLQRLVLTLYTYDKTADDTSLLNTFRQSLSLISKVPVMMVYSYQAKRHYYDNKSLILHRPLSNASIAENILHMLRPDCKFTKEEARLLDLCMVVHAEHGGGNNSAFATHVVSSTGTDTYSAISTAIGSLKGPKHGGANIMVRSMINNIIESCNWQNYDELSSYLDDILDKKVFNKKGLIYGMGHAVYTKSDPRAVLLKKKAKELAAAKGYTEKFELLENIEKLTVLKFKERKGKDFEICANVDLYAGLVYEMLGIPPELYTPIFTVARMAGWCAHRLEQTRDEKIMRPGYISIASENNYTSITER
ncbi:citrate synthase [Miniphocaeibacter massiliensis]|uniref:citrate synthase n=1 Tax=Miniphocaeibacter massiliensis TaxID=2041841 RepID=UPI000C0887F8|nr:citrate synthase [Miniphocaeibacter massiliensis]